jgi:hypothetical protein
MSNEKNKPAKDEQNVPKSNPIVDQIPPKFPDNIIIKNSREMPDPKSIIKDIEKK